MTQDLANGNDVGLTESEVSLYAWTLARKIEVVEELLSNPTEYARICEADRERINRRSE